MKLLELPIRKVEIKQSVINLLEMLLEKAKAGDIHSMMIASVNADLSTWTGYTQTEHAQLQLGAMRYLEYEFVRAVVDGE